MTDRELLLRALQKSPLFEGECADRAWSIKSFGRASVIPEEQNGIGCIGLILSGSAEVTPNEQGAVSTLGRGAEFGICNIFVHEDMPTRLKARTPLKAAYLPKEVFAAVLGENPALMYRYVRLCNRKMIYLATKLRLMSIPDCTRRLAFWILSNASGGSVSLPHSKDELARVLGISRASLFRAISSMEGQGIISSVGNKIVILNPEAEILRKSAE